MAVNIEADCEVIEEIQDEGGIYIVLWPLKLNEMFLRKARSKNGLPTADVSGL